MKTKVLTLEMALFLTISMIAQENDKRFGFEFSSGLSLATGKLAGASLKPGLGFEGLLHYRFMPHLGLYGGWGWNRFAARNSFAGPEVCFEETGYVFGLNFKHPITNSKLDYYLRAGALINHIETENSDGDIVNDSKHGLGLQLAGGLNIKLGSNWSLAPGLKFNTLSRDTEFEGTSRHLNYQYISARVGIAKSF
jgi:hypothetical protein